jgi:hypothetical protein
MSESIGDVDGQTTGCADLGRRENCGPVDGVTAEEAETIEMLAELFVNAMMQLEQEHGLTPRQMQEYFAGRLELKKGEEG